MRAIWMIRRLPIQAWAAAERVSNGRPAGHRIGILARRDKHPSQTRLMLRVGWMA